MIMAEKIDETESQPHKTIPLPSSRPTRIPLPRNSRFNKYFTSDGAFMNASEELAKDDYNGLKQQELSSTEFNSSYLFESSTNEQQTSQSSPDGLSHSRPLFAATGGSDYGDAEMDPITQLQSEHSAYVAILEETHGQEMAKMRREIERLQKQLKRPVDNQGLHLEVENRLAHIREELEVKIREEQDDVIQKEREHMKESMAKELEKITAAVREEAKAQLQTQVEIMRKDIEGHIRLEMQSETERKVRLALVQQMRPQVRAELEQILRLEIQTAYRDELRKEVEVALAPELERRIASELKAKNAKTQATQKEQAEASLQSQLATAKKELEERVRREADAKLAPKIAKKVDLEVRNRMERLRQEVRAEMETQAKSQIEAAYAQLKQERAEIARLRSAENVRRAREDAAHKEAQEELQSKIAEFRRYMQEEEARLARMKAVTQWREDHQKRSPNFAGPIPSIAPSPSSPAHSHSISSPTPTTSIPTSVPALPTSPELLTGVSNTDLRLQSTVESPTVVHKPTGLAFDFTFDVKLIAAKLISDAREYATREPSTTTDAAPVAHPIEPTQPDRLSQRPPVAPPTPSSPVPTRYSLGQISTEQQAQREFENQPPIVPPAGVLGARLRVLLPRLYQLWDDCEISHIHRRDFSNALRVLDVAQAERRVATEIARLRRVLPTIHQEMALVVRREAIKARLAQEDQMPGTLTPAEKASLQVELRRVTASVLSSVAAWEAANNQPFLYRGFPYISLISPQ